MQYMYSEQPSVIVSSTHSPNSLVNSDEDGLVCLICLEELAHEDDSNGCVHSLRCGHKLCDVCFKNYLQHRVETAEEAFPTCYVGYCNVVTPNRVLQGTLEPDIFSRAIELQSERQARSVDGVPLFCSSKS